MNRMNLFFSPSRMNLFLTLLILALAIFAPDLFAAQDVGLGAALIGLNTQMTPGQARVVDPVLSTVARGYKDQRFVYLNLFPEVSVGARGGKIISFGKEEFQLYNTQRAPGARTKRVQFGYSGENYSLEQHALEGLVADEIREEAANAAPGINLASLEINKTQRIIHRTAEKFAADQSTDPANYAAGNKITLSGTDKWSDPNADVLGQMDDGKDAISDGIGLDPNTLVLSQSGYRALRRSKQIKDQFKYTGSRSITLEMLQEFFDIENIVVGKARYHDGTQFQYMWGNAAVLAYVETQGLASMGSPSYGYTYRLRGYPAVNQPYYDNNSKSWVYPVTDERKPVIAGADAGYLFQAVA